MKLDNKGRVSKEFLSDVGDGVILALLNQVIKRKAVC